MRLRTLAIIKVIVLCFAHAGTSEPTVAIWREDHGEMWRRWAHSIWRQIYFSNLGYDENYNSDDKQYGDAAGGL
mgnify:FL=1